MKIFFSPEAEAQLLSLYDYIADKAAPDVAAGFTEAIVDFCEGLTTFPNRGMRRDDLRPGLRTIGFRHRMTIAFHVEGETVNILGIYYGGRNFEAMFLDNQD